MTNWKGPLYEQVWNSLKHTAHHADQTLGIDVNFQVVWRISRHAECDHEIQLFNLEDAHRVEKVRMANRTGSLISQSVLKYSAGSAVLQLKISSDEGRKGEAGSHLTLSGGKIGAWCRSVSEWWLYLIECNIWLKTEHVPARTHTLQYGVTLMFQYTLKLSYFEYLYIYNWVSFTTEESLKTTFTLCFKVQHNELLSVQKRTLTS